jgi:hypothetical protein
MLGRNMLRAVVHEKKKQKKKEKTKSFFIFDQKSLFLFSAYTKKKPKNGFVFCLFCLFFLIKNHFHVKWTKKKSFCFDLKISLFFYDWSIDA